MHTFSILARYGPFWLMTWSKIENFEIFHKTKINYLIKTNDSCFTVKVKMGHILMKHKYETLNFLYVPKWVTNYQKIDKTFKKCGGKLTYFCLGPKTWIGRWDPSFSLRSKILVFGSTFFTSTFDFGTIQELCLKKF